MSFVSCVVGFYRSQSSISRHRPRKLTLKFNMCDFVATSQAFVAKVVIVCVHWCPHIVRHRAPLCVLLTHVWKPGLTKSLGSQTRVYKLATLLADHLKLLHKLIN